MLLIFKFVLRDLISILQIIFTLCFFLIVFPGPHERAINVSLKQTKIIFFRQSGFVDVEAVLKLPRFSGYCEPQVKKVVELNDKQRFTLRKSPLSGKLQIRANQGHTIKVSIQNLTFFMRRPQALHNIESLFNPHPQLLEFFISKFFVF